jgi:general secretion pathway protein D
MIPSPGTIPLSGSISSAIKQTAVLTLPSATFRFFKQDVDAKTLANPRVRVLNGKSAKIHIGDRVPLRVSTIVNVTGQVNTTYDYKDIGIKLNVEPTINLDNSATVKLGLEVSSLGANLGTTAEPAFRIGTRNAETFMLLRDGETAILGGLIRDEDRKTIIKVPLLGDIPVAGALFSSFDTSKERTDVLLTITPRIVRGWELPAKEARQFYSGTEEKYLDQGPFKNLALPLPEVTEKSDTGNTTSQPPAAGQPVTPAAPSPDNGSDALISQPAVFGFSQPVYTASTETDMEIKLLIENVNNNAREISADLQFNPQLMQFIKGGVGEFSAESFQVVVNEAGSAVHLTVGLSSNAARKEKGVLATLRFRARKAGISNLVYQNPSIKNAAGEAISPQAQSARVIIQ